MCGHNSLLNSCILKNRYVAIDQVGLVNHLSYLVINPTTMVPPYKEQNLKPDFHNCNNNKTWNCNCTCTTSVIGMNCSVASWFESFKHGHHLNSNIILAI